MSERKLTKTVISSKARNLIVLKIQALKISPYGRNDKKRCFRSGTRSALYPQIFISIDINWLRISSNDAMLISLYIKTSSYVLAFFEFRLMGKGQH